MCSPRSPFSLYLVIGLFFVFLSLASFSSAITTRFPPTVELPQSISCIANSACTINATASDSDGVIADTYWSVVSSGVGGDITYLTPASGLSVTINASAPGWYIVTFTAYDNHNLNGTATSTMTVISLPPEGVVVTPTPTPNQPPLVDAGANVSCVAGLPCTLNGVALDPDGDPITYYLWYPDPSMQAGDISWITPTNVSTAAFVASENGTYHFYFLAADDDHLPSGDDVYVIVGGNISQQGYRGPHANAGGSRAVAPNQVVLLDGSLSSDLPGITLQYAWMQVAGPQSTLSNADTVRAQFTPALEGTYVFQLTVTNPVAVSDSDNATIIVSRDARVQERQEDEEPVEESALDDSQESSESSGEDRGSGAPGGVPFITPGGTVQLTTGETDGSVGSYYWQQVGGPSVNLDDPTSSSPTFSNAPAGEYTFTVTRTDADGNPLPPKTVKVVVDPKDAASVSSTPLWQNHIVLGVGALIVFLFAALGAQRMLSHVAVKTVGNTKK